MSLILTLGNSQQVIQISDRRLTYTNKPPDEESNKATIILCEDARLAYGYAGLASVNGFRTERWLYDVLMACAPPDFQAGHILNRLEERATNDFNSLYSLRNVSQSQKRISIMFSGYLSHHSPPLLVYAILTNFQDFKTGVNSNEAWDKFKCTYWNEKKTCDDKITLIQAIGYLPAIEKNDIGDLKEMLYLHKPAKAILNKGIEVMRKTATCSQANGTIGKQLSGIIIPRNSSIAASHSYHTDYASHKLYSPGILFLLKQGTSASFFSFEEVNKDNPPTLAIPKVRRNDPCPCKSGKKYKRCHGKFS